MKRPILYVITDTRIQSRYTHLELASMAQEGGADYVQYRDKRLLSLEERYRVAETIAHALKGSDTQFVINDHVEIATMLQAGLHVGQKDASPCSVRSRVRCLGLSTHSWEQAQQAQALPLDYMAVGPIFDTFTKENPSPTVGIQALSRIAKSSKHPVIAIGGITQERVLEVMNTGVRGVAVVSAVASQADPREATRQWRRLLDTWWMNQQSSLERA